MEEDAFEDGGKDNLCIDGHAPSTGCLPLESHGQEHLREEAENSDQEEHCYPFEFGRHDDLVSPNDHPAEQKGQ